MTQYGGASLGAIECRGTWIPERRSTDQKGKGSTNGRCPEWSGRGEEQVLKNGDGVGGIQGGPFADQE
jgi:hypothetical protein